MSYSKIVLHTIFPTHARQRTISEEHCSELYAYMAGIARKLDCSVLGVNGMPDHVHMIITVPPTITPADLVQHLKTSSSKWLKAHGELFPMWDGWAKGYAIFSCFYAQIEPMIRYVANQKEHHRTVSFEEEQVRIYKSLGIAYKPEYLL